MFSEVEANLRVKYELGDNDSKIINRVAELIEGRCGPSGMVISDSVRLISRTPPFLNKMENGGLVEIIVNYAADVVTLPPGTVVSAKIIKSVRSDSAAVYIVNGHVVGMILLPNILQTPKLTDLIIPDHYVNVRIIESEFGTGWGTINAVGVVVSPSTSEEVVIDSSADLSSKNIRVGASEDW